MSTINIVVMNGSLRLTDNLTLLQAAKENKPNNVLLLYILNKDIINFPLRCSIIEHYIKNINKNEKKVYCLNGEYDIVIPAVVSYLIKKKFKIKGIYVSHNHDMESNKLLDIVCTKVMLHNIHVHYIPDIFLLNPKSSLNKDRTPFVNLKDHIKYLNSSLKNSLFKLVRCPKVNWYNGTLVATCSKENNLQNQTHFIKDINFDIKQLNTLSVKDEYDNCPDFIALYLGIISPRELYNYYFKKGLNKRLNYLINRDFTLYILHYNNINSPSYLLDKNFFKILNKDINNFWDSYGNNNDFIEKLFNCNNYGLAFLINKLLKENVSKNVINNVFKHILINYDYATFNKMFLL